MEEQKIRCMFELGCMDEPRELCDLEGTLLNEKGKVVGECKHYTPYELCEYSRPEDDCENRDACDKHGYILDKKGRKTEKCLTYCERGRAMFNEEESEQLTDSEQKH